MRVKLHAAPKKPEFEPHPEISTTAKPSSQFLNIEICNKCLKSKNPIKNTSHLLLAIGGEEMVDGGKVVALVE